MITYGVSKEEAARFGLPCGGTVHIFVAEADRNRVRRIAPDGTATVVAGGGGCRGRRLRAARLTPQGQVPSVQECR